MAGLLCKLVAALDTSSVANAPASLQTITRQSSQRYALSAEQAQRSSLVETAERLERLLGQFGFVTFLGAGVSLLTCYYKLIAGTVATTFGIVLFDPNIHLQAVIMWLFVALAVAGLYYDRRRHGKNLPLVLGAIAFVLIFGTLYTVYEPRIEVLAYLFLIAGAFLNQYFLMQRLYAQTLRHADELRTLNSSLSEQVREQVTEIEKLAHLKRFLSPEIADLVTREGNADLLESHRQLVACLFCDIRNFTQFSEDVEPEDVMDVLKDMHRRADAMVSEHGGTICYRSGDGLMVIFNDPIPSDEPVLQATKLALHLKAAFMTTSERWLELGYNLGFGIGISYGYATLGMIGSDERSDYTAIGRVVNIAARLCDRARDGEILIDKRAQIEIADVAEFAEMTLEDVKGISRPVEVFSIKALRDGT